jgi:hypothetical protein
MPETLEPKIKETLRGYFRDVKTLHNEANKTARFAALIGELFPDAVAQYSRDVEKLIRIDQTAGQKRGRADAYYGNAIIEFEKSLAATLEEAKRQLCEYVAGVWQKENRKSLRPLLAVASDGVRWISYRPVLPDGEEPTPENVVLDELRDFKVADDNRPAMLKGQFDFIIGNPPWLSYRYISDPEYQEEIKQRAVVKYKIAPKSQKLMTQMELATVFLAHSMATFAKKDARLGFVMPRSVLSADQHQNLITRKYSTEARFQLTGYWDLWEVTPIFNVPCCVLFAKRYPLNGNSKDVLPVIEWKGNLPGRDVSWTVAKDNLEHREREGRVIYLGSRAALSTAPGSRTETKPSKYQAVFRQGAAIVPRSFYFVRLTDFNGIPEPERQYWAVTDPEQSIEAKPPYDDVDVSGMVEGRFIFTTALSKHVLPFVHLVPVDLVLPITVKDGNLTIIKAKEMIDKGFREFGTWMQTVEALWNTKRGDKADTQSVYEWLDYQGKLTSQSLRQRHLVLYNATGTNVSAAYFDRDELPIPFVVDHKLYWAAFSDPDEAHYVVAVLNSETANQAIKPFQSTGLLGERDIHKKLLELPIPLFNPEDTAHRQLSGLGLAARTSAAEALKSGTFPLHTTLARQRGFIRTHLETQMKQIDTLVIKLLSK